LISGIVEATAESELGQPASEFLSTLEVVYAALVSKEEHPISVRRLVVFACVAILEGQGTRSSQARSHQLRPHGV
jgi:hypothetical protein